jgi:hypothetical protein
MKLLLFKVLLHRRARDEGFTLPVVFAIGLIMLLLGVLNILSASEENLNAASDNQKNKALAIAEVGVTRYRELLDKNRILTVYNNTEWSDITNTCDIRTEIINLANSDEPHIVNNGSEEIGQYQLVSYIYDIDNDLDDDDNNQFAPNDDNPNTNDLITFNDNANYKPRGILTLKSKANDGSEAQVQVEIPIRINQEDMNNLMPALWLGSSNATDFGNLKLGEDDNFQEDQDGNIVLSKPAIDSTPGCDNPADITGGEIITDARTLPSIVLPPTGAESAAINTLSNSTDLSADPRYNLPTTELILGRPETTPNLHRLWKTLEWDAGEPEPEWKIMSAGDNDQDRKIPHYFYQTPTGTGLTVNNQTLVSDGSAKVILYVDGDINLNNKAILDAGGAYASSMLLEIYGTENTDEIIFNPNGETIEVTALIHAPDATVKVEGTGNVNIKGAVWVKDWDDNSGGNVEVRITPDSAGFGERQAYDFYFATDNRAAKPITNAPTDWEIQEVKDN